MDQRQKDLLKTLATSRYVYCQNLPDEINELESLHLIKVAADKTFTGTKLMNLIIDTLGEKPKRSLEAKSRQVKELIEDLAKKNKRVMFIIDEAHQIPRRTLQAIKSIPEIIDYSTSEASESQNAGFIFLGDRDALKTRLEANQGVEMRTLWL